MDVNIERALWGAESLMIIGEPLLSNIPHSTISIKDGFGRSRLTDAWRDMLEDQGSCH
jgi:hypothetical protein